ncbi:type IV pilin [Haloarcula sp. GH36]|uniref:type IV pilin n=1 Tax=Haloarcula montana TaxID=3111776 RepID=UPI002D792624|nr:type IV pilin [Haloarcula sp. GH36]
MPQRHRAVSSIISTVLLVAVVVVLSATISVFALDLGSNIQSEAPYVEVSGEFVEAVDAGEQAIAITHLAGDSAQTEQLYVSGSKPLDIGGRPNSSSTPANDAYASRREKFTEASGSNPPQVGIGATWDAGETIYVDPEGTADGVTVSIYWTSVSVEGVNPGEPEGDTTYKLTTVEMGSTS